MMEWRKEVGDLTDNSDDFNEILTTTISEAESK